MNEQAWQTVAEPATDTAARILLGLLHSESIEARLRSNVPVPGLALSFRIEVPPPQVERALAVLNSRPVSEEELVALALDTKPIDPS